ncbi:MAG: hypothetical protein LAO77_12100 [Acidobacteriia bacterium]|nr:hypothetical protein [Terriglobia bacterium]
MIQRPAGMGAFTFVVLSTLRSTQLIRGCRPRVEGVHKRTVIAQIEVAEGKVLQQFAAPAEIAVVPSEV